jgi:membrane-bound lytic murein transglycosylase D
MEPTIHLVRKVSLGGKDIDIALVAKWTGLHESDVLQLNPGINGSLVVAAATPTLLLPVGAARNFDTASSKFTGQRAKYTAHVVEAGERLAHLARKLRMKAKTLRAINGISANHEPKPGSTLLVLRTARSSQDISWKVATSARLETQPTTTRSNKSPARKRVATGRIEPAVRGAKRTPHSAINQVSAAAKSNPALARSTDSQAAPYRQGEVSC